MHDVRQEKGPPLLLIHGLGGSWRSWSPILESLASRREVIAVDLPGFGQTPPLPGEVSIATLADAITKFLHAEHLTGIDAVRSSMAARLVLELARRGGVLGAVVSLNPGGFWTGWQRHAFYASIWASIRLVRLLQPVMPALTRSAIDRTMLFAQFSAHPWRLSPHVTLDEMRSYAASPSFDELLRQLASSISIWRNSTRRTSEIDRTSAHNRMRTPRLRVFSQSGKTRCGVIPRCVPALVRTLRPLPLVGRPWEDRSLDP